jgi:hypothetical protein
MTLKVAHKTSLYELLLHYLDRFISHVEDHNETESLSIRYMSRVDLVHRKHSARLPAGILQKNGAYRNNHKFWSVIEPLHEMTRDKWCSFHKKSYKMIKVKEYTVVKFIQYARKLSGETQTICS